MPEHFICAWNFKFEKINAHELFPNPILLIIDRERKHFDRNSDENSFSVLIYMHVNRLQKKKKIVLALDNQK